MALTIGEVAKRSGIGLETVRFYERKGLIEEPPRTDSGYRQYPAAVVARLRFIKRAKELGFSLKEILELLSLRVDSDTTCADVKKRADLKILDIEQKISILREMKRALTKLVVLCAESGPTSDCPILEALEQD